MKDGVEEIIFETYNKIYDKEYSSFKFKKLLFLLEFKLV